MAILLNQIGQIAVTVDDVDAAERFYGEVLGLRKLYRFGSLLFFDCGGVRLLVEKSNRTPFQPESSLLYFRAADLALTVAALEQRGVIFTQRPGLTAEMEDHDLWMAFFKDRRGTCWRSCRRRRRGISRQARSQG